MNGTNIAITVAIIGIFASIITVSLTKFYEQKVELRRIKEQQYIDFLSYIAKYKRSPIEENASELSAKIQTIYLVGSKNVQIALSEFLNGLLAGNNAMQDELYATLIFRMKKDLYGLKLHKSTDISLDKIRFIIFNSNKKIKYESKIHLIPSLLLDKY